MKSYLQCCNIQIVRNWQLNKIPNTQGWARDGKARDRDETITFRERDVGFTSRDETLKLRDQTETRRL